MSVIHESPFSVHLVAKKTKVPQTSSGQDYARMSSGFAVPVMCAREQLRGVVSRRYH